MTTRCGACTLCCNVTAVWELQKPAGAWCKHCDVGAGCSIWPLRPASCAAFECAYYANDTWGTHLRPDLLGVMFEVLPGRATVGALLDPERPEALKNHRVRRIISRYLEYGRPVMAVLHGRRPFVFLPPDRRWTVERVFEDVRAHIVREAEAAVGTGEEAQKLAERWLKISAGANDGGA